VSWVGSAVPRLEDPALLSGKGRFVDDFHMPNMLHAAVVRSPYAHARIRGIDVSAAMELPGVHAVLTHADLPEPFREARLLLLVPNPAIRHPVTYYALAKDEVCFAGEGVAFVVADDRYIAEDAAALVAVDYEPLPAAADCRAAMASGAAVTHADRTDNIAADFPIAYGDVDDAFAGAGHVFKESIFTHRGGGHAIECRGVVASYDPAGGAMTLWANTQSPHMLRDVYAKMMGISEAQIRVIAPADVGGGFGPKGMYYQEHFCAAIAARKLGCPVKWTEDRRENFLATYQERDQHWDVEVAVDKDGRLRGVRGSLIHDAGAYLPWGIITPFISATTVPGPYVLPAYRMNLTAVFTNKVATTPVRGAGRPQAAFVMERLMDRIARELDLDPAEVRRRNFIQPEQMPYSVGLVFRDGSPVVYDSGDYPACQQKAIALAEYESFRERQSAARQEGRYIGIGLGSYVEGTGLGPFEGVSVKVEMSGKVAVQTGAAPQGQGHQTMLAQIVADGLGVKPENISVTPGDTGGVGIGIGTFASRITANAGPSAQLASKRVREKLIRAASHLLEAAEEDLDLGDGRIFIKGVPDHGKTFAEIATFANGMPGFSLPGGVTPGLDDTAYFTPERSTYANGAHVVEVEVDIETGAVTILRYSTAHDCGSMINPKMVDGQVMGGVAHGIGNALFEWMRYDDDAQPQTVNFGEYLIPMATDVPRVDQAHIQTPTPLNPLGVKGAGEGGTIPALAAIAAAIEDALAPFGVHIAQTPVTPPYLLGLLDAARKEPGGG
jgi:carbon-monoxide dehydrogenase large subunit